MQDNCPVAGPDVDMCLAVKDGNVKAALPRALCSRTIESASGPFFFMKSPADKDMSYLLQTVRGQETGQTGANDGDLGASCCGRSHLFGAVGVWVRGCSGWTLL